ncbi:hypothetical protein NH340_JMT01258 [Sarcoptes scabiei]|nr:hypothetical protein NH340_JMT01258 [Sarcoptes scabiei]
MIKIPENSKTSVTQSFKTSPITSFNGLHHQNHSTTTTSSFEQPSASIAIPPLSTTPVLPASSASDRLLSVDESIPFTIDQHRFDAHQAIDSVHQSEHRCESKEKILLNFHQHNNNNNNNNNSNTNQETQMKSESIHKYSQKILNTSNTNQNNLINSNHHHSSNDVRNVMLYGIPIVSLLMDGQERLCLAQISNTLLKNFSYNEIHNRRVALGITCVQCTPVQLELLRRAGAMPVSSRRCGMITKREAERLCKSFLAETEPPKLPETFSFDVYHSCAWGCRGSFTPSRYNSSRAKCIKCNFCGLFFSPNKFIFHSHRLPSSKYVQPDAANFNSWRRHIKLSGSPEPADYVIYAWEDVKAMFNGGSRKRAMTTTLNSFTKNQEHHQCGSRSNPKQSIEISLNESRKSSKNSENCDSDQKIYLDNDNSCDNDDSMEYQSSFKTKNETKLFVENDNLISKNSATNQSDTDLFYANNQFNAIHSDSRTSLFTKPNCYRKRIDPESSNPINFSPRKNSSQNSKSFDPKESIQLLSSPTPSSSSSLSSSASSPLQSHSVPMLIDSHRTRSPPIKTGSIKTQNSFAKNFHRIDDLNESIKKQSNNQKLPYLISNSTENDKLASGYSMLGTTSNLSSFIRHRSNVNDLIGSEQHPTILNSLLTNSSIIDADNPTLLRSVYTEPNLDRNFVQAPTYGAVSNFINPTNFPTNLAEFMWSMASRAVSNSATPLSFGSYANFLWPTATTSLSTSKIQSICPVLHELQSSDQEKKNLSSDLTGTNINPFMEDLHKTLTSHQSDHHHHHNHNHRQPLNGPYGPLPTILPNFIHPNLRLLASTNPQQSQHLQNYLNYSGSDYSTNRSYEMNENYKSIIENPYQNNFRSLASLSSKHQTESNPIGSLNSNEILNARDQLIFDAYCKQHNQSEQSLNSTMKAHLVNRSFDYKTGSNNLLNDKDFERKNSDDNLLFDGNKSKSLLENYNNINKNPFIINGNRKRMESIEDNQYRNQSSTNNNNNKGKKMKKIKTNEKSRCHKEFDQNDSKNRSPLKDCDEIQEKQLKTFETIDVDRTISKEQLNQIQIQNLKNYHQKDLNEILDFTNCLESEKIRTSIKNEPNINYSDDNSKDLSQSINILNHQNHLNPLGYSDRINPSSPKNLD